MMETKTYQESRAEIEKARDRYMEKEHHTPEEKERYNIEILSRGLWLGTK